MKNRNMTFRIIISAIAFCAFFPQVHAISPAPDGCYPNYTTAEGCDALNVLTTGAGNTGVGWRSLSLDSTGSFNTGVGAGALILNNGDSNTATGAAALLLNTTGIENTAVGTDALVYNDSGGNNTAVGAFALNDNYGAYDNTAVGAYALYDNNGDGYPLGGGGNSALGAYALSNNVDGNSNVAFGSYALYNNAGFIDFDVGNRNTAVGSYALYDNQGSDNTAVGTGVLNANVDGTQNTAVGGGALLSNTEGDSNTALGANAGINLETGSNNIYIGDAGFAGDESNVIAIGAIASSGTPYTATFIGGIYDDVIADRAVYIGVDGKLGTLASSRRYKEEINPMDKTSEALFALKPVTFRYKQEIDPLRKLSFGLIAEDVAEISPELITRDKQGKPQTVRYEAVNAMLLNEFLKEHKKLGEQQSSIAQLESNAARQEAIITQLKKEIETVVARFREHESKIQKADAYTEMDRSALKMVANDQ